MPPPDFTDLYNTVLTSEEEARFQEWAKKHRKHAELADYDLRGLWLKHGGMVDEQGHAYDTFKKPNHATFSNESIYHGVDGYEGGQWIQHGKDQWEFQAGPANLTLQTPEELQQYFQRREPDAKLTIPTLPWGSSPNDMLYGRGR